jgi:hypothetical protein
MSRVTRLGRLNNCPAGLTGFSNREAWPERPREDYCPTPVLLQMSVSDHAMKRFGRHIASLAFAAGIVLHVSGEAHAQDICGLGDRVVEILSTIDACAATNSQLAELESVRQDILAPSDDTECGDLEERIAHLELTIPRLSDRGPSTLEQPVPTCEANQEVPPAARPKATKRLSL